MDANVLLLILALTTPAAQATTWRFIAASDSGNAVWVDIDSTEVVGDTLLTWEQSVTPTLNFAIVNAQYACRGHALRYLEFHAYQPNGDKVAVGGPTPWMQVVPGSIGEALHTWACSVWKATRLR